MRWKILFIWLLLMVVLALLVVISDGSIPLWLLPVMGAPALGAFALFSYELQEIPDIVRWLERITPELWGAYQRSITG